MYPQSKLCQPISSCCWYACWMFCCWIVVGGGVLVGVMVLVMDLMPVMMEVWMSGWVCRVLSWFSRFRVYFSVTRTMCKFGQQSTWSHVSSHLEHKGVLPFRCCSIYVLFSLYATQHLLFLLFFHGLFCFFGGSVLFHSIRCDCMFLWWCSNVCGGIVAVARGWMCRWDVLGWMKWWLLFRWLGKLTS